MTTDPTDRASRPDPAAVFRQMREDADELLRARHRAEDLFRVRAAATFDRLSELLDEVLPTDSAAEARVARALEMDPSLLSRLRQGDIDPLRAPQIALAALGQSLRLDLTTFRSLLRANRRSFATDAVAARGGMGESEEAAWTAFTNAWERVRRDDASQIEE
jgi:hypothetical protein